MKRLDNKPALIGAAGWAHRSQPSPGSKKDQHNLAN